MDLQADAVRMGWLPFYPQFDVNPIELVQRAARRGRLQKSKLPSGWSRN